MTDRELLELAAKAAGVEGRIRQFQLPYRSEIHIGIGKHRWNPLTDDGDALRLAVKIGWLPDRVEFAGLAMSHDPYAATRRAIVRAAAEIGRAMK